MLVMLPLKWLSLKTLRIAAQFENMIIWCCKCVIETSVTYCSNIVPHRSQGVFQEAQRGISNPCFPTSYGWSTCSGERESTYFTWQTPFNRKQGACFCHYSAYLQPDINLLQAGNRNFLLIPPMTLLNKDGALRTWENHCTGRGSCSSKFMDTEFGWLWHLEVFPCPNVPSSPWAIFPQNLFICFFFFILMFHFPLLPLVGAAGFNEHFESQQIIPNRNVQPWSWTLLPDALCLLTGMSP